MLRVALGIGVSADDALLPLRDLDLEPVMRTFFLIKTLPLLGENSFQTAASGHFKQVAAFLRIMIRKSNDVDAFEHGLQQFLSLLQSHAAQIESVEVEQIECVIHNRNALAPWSAASTGLESGALLHQAKGWTAFLIQRDDLPAKNRALPFHKSRQFANFGKLRGEIVLTTGDQAHATGF